MDLLAVGILLVVGVALVGYSVFPHQPKTRDTVRRRLDGSRSVADVADIRERARANATRGLVKRAAPVLSKLVTPTSDEALSQLRLKLASAGYRHRQAQTVFLASKTILSVGLLISAAVVGASLGYDWQKAALMALFGGGVGFMLPNLWLGLVAGARQDKVRRGLPDVLDLMVVSVESGLALDATIKRVGDEMVRVHPELAEEFRIATAESQMGIPRGEALEHLAQRAGVEELRNLTSVITQAERFGTSIAKALRNQGTSLRVKRRQQAEERAQKTAVKLMIPLVLFIFPAMGVVLAGPAIIQLIGTFGAG
jgi:tight adherence protein C